MGNTNLTFVTGGARSGKSAYAERLAAASGMAVTYIATARQHDDVEFSARIALHRARRPSQWDLVEESVDLATALRRTAAPQRCVLIDCLTLWLANLLFPVGEEVGSPDASARIEAFLSACEKAAGKIIVVSNEIGMGIVPLGAQTRRYVDELGRLNQRVAAQAGVATLMAAGLPLQLKP
ncbi:bifunctional adenosylcobinamide kinase/adenosylcobinamide-phosphate guanylyltransferase [Bordetella sp. FB-8]|uniref:bifunctional adenosylcobinamide kinase/adenosylcobinamide-phosphate guanylyltransferase n=1 Tax=Bordetella sp. FB-8 TaxID=1159870 RepID=UPI00036FFA10|nr:bifunctional adenosylcobinamide kinase/adenosylcobinamide-phosphate guanylyltransferase [Bordetella sp. FB-8]